MSIGNARSTRTKLIDIPVVASGRVQHLAGMLQQDIRRRGLRPGDRYMTSEEAAHLLEVSTGTAHQAMRFLVDKNVLDRRRKQGTYVGPAVEPPSIGQRPKVYVLSPAEAVRDPSYARTTNGYFPAIAKVFGGASLQLEYFPSGDVMGFVRSLVEEANTVGNLAGFVLQRSTYEMQDFFQQNIRRYPAVVAGNVFSGITQLPWVAHDQHQVGKYIIDYFLRKGHKRIAVLMLSTWVAGDNYLMSGVTEAIESSSERIEHLDICSLPPYDNAIRHRVREMLTSEKRPTALIVRMAAQVSLIEEIAKEVGLNVPQDLEIVLSNLGATSHHSHSIARIDDIKGMDHVGEILGRVLIDLRSGKQIDTPGILLPVRFIESENDHH